MVAVVITRLSKYMLAIAGGLLILMMGITLLDVILRMFGRPIVGVFELISFLGAGVIGFSMADTSLKKSHVYVDFLITRFSKERQNVLHTTTKILAFSLFALMSWYFVVMGRDFYISKTVSGGLKFPYYPVAFGLGASCIAQCLVLVLEIYETWRRP